mmetsp:Transcript_5654/g.13301  ORF Transcript_5654/g.13301 Transcript_5654/m.13301 type:complete len:291 (-) Transcript_5654:216-1088(-)
MIPPLSLRSTIRPISSILSYQPLSSIPRILSHQPRAQYHPLTSPKGRAERVVVVLITLKHARDNGVIRRKLQRGEDHALRKLPVASVVARRVDRLHLIPVENDPVLEVHLTLPRSVRDAHSLLQLGLEIGAGVAGGPRVHPRGGPPAGREPHFAELLLKVGDALAVDRVLLVGVGVESKDDNVVGVALREGLVQRLEHWDGREAVGVAVERRKQVPASVDALDGDGAKVPRSSPPPPRQPPDLLCKVGPGALDELVLARQDHGILLPRPCFAWSTNDAAASWMKMMSASS